MLEDNRTCFIVGGGWKEGPRAQGPVQLPHTNGRGLLGYTNSLLLSTATNTEKKKSGGIINVPFCCKTVKEGTNAPSICSSRLLITTQDLG